VILLVAAVAIFAGAANLSAAAQAKNGKANAPKAVPRIPAGAAGETIRLGQHIFELTPRYAPKYVGNQMSCSDCHLQDGRASYSAPMVGLTHIFPTYNQRAGRVITLAERIQQCFARSENGKPLSSSSREMQALLAYIGWLSRSQPAAEKPPARGLVKLPPLKGDPTRGAQIYAQQCSACHGSDGKGVPPILPPLWGPASFNSGAGMSTVEKMAAFVQYNMPQNAPGSLSAQQAYDVAAYVNSKPRPKLNPRYRKY
jgi:thiosulfate dehydrogenase